MLSTNSRNGIQWYSSSKIPVSHGMFTSHGGTSEGEYDSLNLSFGVGDNKENVPNNRERVKQVLNIRHLASSRQIHGNMIARIEPVDSDLELEGYDALITNQPEVGLLIQQADCQAILLHDPHRQVIAAIHNGWRGSVANIIAETIQSMLAHFSVSPEDIRAVISPSLGPCCGEFINFRQELPFEFQPFQTTAE
ncbi:MAG: polyphenol oxidase family protein, partial [Desulfobulbaceae bacterium]|nr:polyphenol oxidase family protein [Desulfobulbaceae bacterium]